MLPFSVYPNNIQFVIKEIRAGVKKFPKLGSACRLRKYQGHEGLKS